MFRILILACALGTLSLVGCGSDGPELADVSGLVSLDGRPIAGAVLTFRPKFSGGTTSYGGTDEDGRYTLNYTDTKAGALIGEYEVDIEPPRKLSRDDIADLKSQGLPVPDQSAIVKIPVKYRGENALTAKVEAGSNAIDFILDTR
jgi:hypothetical protein